MKFRSKKQSNSRKKVQTQPRYVATNNYYRPTRKPDMPSLAEQKNVNKKRPSMTFSSLLNGVIVILLFVVMGFAFTMTAQPEVTLTAGAYAYRDNQAYAERAAEILSSNILQRSKPFFRSAQFEEQMQTSFPEITTINAIVPLGGRTLSVFVETSEPLVAVQNGAERGIVDASGVIVALGREFAGDTQLPLLRLTTPLEEISLGERLLTSQEADLLTLLIREMQLNEALLNVGEGQIEARFKDTAYFAKLSTYSDPQQQVGALLATKQQLTREGQEPQKYIDARVPGRVFVQ